MFSFWERRSVNWNFYCFQHSQNSNWGSIALWLTDGLIGTRQYMRNSDQFALNDSFVQHYIFQLTDGRDFGILFERISRIWISISRIQIPLYTNLYFLIHYLTVRSITYELSPRESTSRVSLCHFFGWLLKSLLSLFLVQMG